MDPLPQRSSEVLLDAIEAVVQKKFRAQGFKRGLIVNMAKQVIENGRTRIEPKKFVR